MTSFMFGLLMFICLVPSVILLYITMYPRNWRKKKRIFGVNNREEFKNDKSEEFIDIVVNTHNKQAIAILIGIIAISIPLLFVPGFTIKMIVWTVFVYISIFVIFVPYALGNSEMKKYKKCLGIVDERVLYADLKNTGNIHALNKPMLFMANIAGVLIIVLAVLIDAGLIFHLKTFEGAYILTAMTASIIATNLILLPIAFMIDNSRNEVISENSDLNANYNRSRKKIFSDYIIILSWFNNIFSVAVTIITLLLDSEFLIVIMLAVYMLVVISATFIYAAKKLALNRKYLTEEAKLVEDDDDYWILGMLYYNPNDKHLNVDKRVGVGMTVNIAHPVGKILAGLGLVTIVISLVSLIWIGLMSVTPIRIIENDRYVICHHLWDEYKIAKDEITAVEYGNLSDLKATRTAGTGMENVAKGTFAVNGKGGCKLFLNPQAGKYIKIETSDRVYYISENTAEETESLYEKLN